MAFSSTHWETKTILVPSANELSILAVIVAIRIVLSWSLSKEIDRYNVDIAEGGKVSWSND